MVLETMRCEFESRHPYHPCVAQMAEASASNPDQSWFESKRRDHISERVGAARSPKPKPAGSTPAAGANMVIVAQRLERPPVKRDIRVQFPAITPFPLRLMVGRDILAVEIDVRIV